MIKVNKFRYLLLAIMIAQNSVGQAREGEFTDAVKAYQNQNYEIAVKIFRKLGQGRDAHSQFNLGVMYENGYGVPKNPSEAFKWYKKAGEMGLTEAENALGNIYNHGKGASQDSNLAMEYYQRAAEKGNVKAQFSLAVMLYSGEPESKDLQESIIWFTKAAEQNYAPAQNNLGVLYEIKKDLQKPIDASRQLYLQAAAQGHSGAMKNLAVIHFSGTRGIPRDNVKALMWAELARTSAKTEDEANSHLGLFDKVKSKMNEKMVNEAVQLARTCKTKGLKNCS
jgi:TPR repeat protein